MECSAFFLGGKSMRGRYWKPEKTNTRWKWIEDTPEDKAKALKAGAMYLTWCHLSEPYKNNGSEPLRFGNFPLDFDNKSAPQKALEEMRLLCLIRLPELYDADPYDFLFYCSGSKGFHCIIPARLFGTENGDPHLPLIYKKIASRWIEQFGLKTLDMQLYKMKRGQPFRIANVRRSNGRYKVPLTLDEVQNLTFEQIWELSKEPRYVERTENT
jgi:hypothetical protein